MKKLARGSSTYRRGDHAQKVMAVLARAYPKAAIVLRYGSAWELLVAVILSAQCTDVRVNSVTRRLFVKYKTLDDYCRANATEFEEDIRPTGFFRTKAKNILACAKIIKDTYHGIVPRTMDELLTLPGVARKTANVVLGNAYGVVSGIAVDTHVLRLSQRLRLVDIDTVGGQRAVTFVGRNGKNVVDFKKDADPVKIERALMEALAPNQWFAATYRLIDHGRAVCTSRSPMCRGCVLRAVCPSSRV